MFLAGGQIGYDWQGDRWVFGLELDASGAVSDGTNTCLAFSPIVVMATCTAGPNGFVTGTTRAGYAFGPQGHTLAYVKGGVAWQNNRGEIANNNEFREGNFAGFPRGQRSSIAVVSVGPSVSALSKRSRPLGPSNLSTTTWGLAGRMWRPLLPCRFRLLQSSQPTQAAYLAIITSERSV